MDKITKKDVEIIIGLQQELKETIGNGKGPFWLPYMTKTTT